MKIRFLSAARLELEAALVYLNEQSEGLGYEFAVEVKRTLERIVRYPDAWPRLSERTRRSRTRRFPYGVIYQQRADEILVIAIMHLRRDPLAWRQRLRGGER